MENPEVMETENIALPTSMVPEGNRSMGKPKVSNMGISLSDVECDSGLILFSVFPCLPETRMYGRGDSDVTRVRVGNRILQHFASLPGG